jgi:type I restriction enzyme S subunit
MMKHYDSYKDSGIEWIGEIPENWNLVSIKHLVYTKITDGPHETPEWVEDGIPFLSVESVQDNKLDFNKKRGFITEELHKVYSKKCKPQRDDIFIVKSGSTTGKSTIVETDEEFNIWSPLCIIRSNKEKILPYFFFNSIKSFYFRRFIELGWSFGTQPNIGMGVIENIKIVLPPLSEQEHIVSYLDDKTTKIDELIQKKLRKIDLLKEYRTSLINTVVTKGLNPNVPMKDSGIEWIGVIPSHWETPKLNYISNKITDGEHISPRFTDTGIPFLSSKDVRETGIDINVNKFVSEEDSIQMRKRCDPEYGDVLVVGRGNSIGRISIVNSNKVFCLLGSVILLKHKNDKIHNTYLFFYLQSPKVFEQLINTSSHSVQPTIYLEGIKNQIVILPPLSEQEQIVSYLDEKTSQIDKTIDIEKKKIELLKEYRQSLISNVVTGKIKVTE